MRIVLGIFLALSITSTKAKKLEKELDDPVKLKSMEKKLKEELGLYYEKAIEKLDRPVEKFSKEDAQSVLKAMMLDIEKDSKIMKEHEMMLLEQEFKLEKTKIENKFNLEMKVGKIMEERINKLIGKMKENPKKNSKIFESLSVELLLFKQKISNLKDNHLKLLDNLFAKILMIELQQKKEEDDFDMLMMNDSQILRKVDKFQKSELKKAKHKIQLVHDSLKMSKFSYADRD